MKTSTFPCVVATTVFILFMAMPCLAHKMRVFAWQEGDQVIAEAKFSGGRLAQGVTVTVSDQSSGEVLVVGNTDTSGRYAFPVPKNHHAVNIVVDGGDGHRATWTLSPAPSASSFPPLAATSAPTASAPKEKTTLASEPVLLTTSLDEAQLRLMIGEVVAAELAPIKRALAESSDAGPTLQDILGALGYILGLAGIAAYLHSRKKNKELK